MQVTQRDYGLRRFVRMRIREENCNMILLAMVVCISATIAGGASILMGDSKPVRFVDRTTGSVEQARSLTSPLRDRACGTAIA